MPPNEKVRLLFNAPTYTTVKSRKSPLGNAKSRTHAVGAFEEGAQSSTDFLAYNLHSSCASLMHG